MTEVIKIEGLRELAAALAKLPSAVSKQVQADVLRARAEPTAVRARELAPHDSGELQQSIRVGDRLSKRQAGLYRKVHPEDVVMFVGAGPLPQAHLQEFGTSRVTPTPFMRPAWDATRIQMVDGIKKDLWDSILQKVGKGE